MSWESFALLACTFLAVSGVTLFAFQRIWAIDERVDARLRALPGRRAVPRFSRRARSVEPPSGQSRSKILGIAARLIPDDQREHTRLQVRLIHAGVYASWAPSVLLFVKLMLMAAPPIVGFVLAEIGMLDPNRALFFGGVAGGLGLLLPSLWLQRRKSRRQAAICRSLPDFLDLLVACVQSGLSLEGALQRVTDELTLAYPLLSGEMAIVQRQMELGATPDLALRSFAERSDLSPLYTLSTLIEQARRFGTSVTDALRTQAEMLRYQREQRAEELAQKASVKILFPTLLCIFPAIFVVLVGPAAVLLYEKFSAEPPTAARSS
ncbi:MAG TPA: type II secretion system F family protein [Planctomycetaceae bacterium]|nr:type II secretion system F family protein [Planctomycetaceae bacterium]